MQPCAYCGDATENEDQYGPACEGCTTFFASNPTPPMPVGTILVGGTEGVMEVQRVRPLSEAIAEQTKKYQ